MVLTSYEGVRQGGKEPEFNSLSYHGHATTATDGVPEQWSVKIFSKKRVSDEWLDKIFMGKVGWVHRKEVGLRCDHNFVSDRSYLVRHIHQWDAYPQLPPTTTFPPVTLDEGLYYVNAFEP
jgi:prenylcysteine oxidase/farnesylcysteine lyase